MALTLHLTRVSPTHHRFEYVRADGTGEQLELATREFLLHDLVHFAVETEAGLRGSFYGLLDRIGGYAELTLDGAALGGEAQITEMIVGPLQKALGPEMEPADLAERINGFMRDMDLRPPAGSPAHSSKLSASGRAACKANGGPRRLAERWSLCSIPGDEGRIDLPRLSGKILKIAPPKKKGGHAWPP